MCHGLSFIHKLFFWVVNSNMANVAAMRSEVLEVRMEMVCTNDIAESQRRKGVLYDMEVVYHPGQKRKKYTRMIVSWVPVFQGEARPLRCW